MSFPRYPKYKDSGVEWLGEVPEHWEPKKIGTISSLKGRLGWQGLKADEYRDDGPYVVSSAHFEDHRINWGACPRVSQERYEIDSNIQLEPGDLLLMKDGAAMGKLAFIDDLPGPACLNSHLLLFRPVARIGGQPFYLPRFAFYFMQTSFFQEHIRVHGTGATFLGISQAAVSRYEICLPPLPEQAAIAAFLDRETDKIDSLVAEQERLIELLKEKRQAVISYAVTKGLNPKAPMKDSGVEWLGEIPAHWQVTRVKQIIASIEQGWSPQCEGIPADPSTEWGVMKVGCVNGGVFRAEENKLLPVDLEPMPELGLRRGDLLVSRANTRELVGSAAVVPESLPRLMLCDKLYRLRPRGGNACPWFLALYFGARAPRAQIELAATGASDSMLNIAQTAIMDLPVPVPSIEEQRAVVAHLERETSKLEALTTEAQRAIDLLQERRTALISAAVTGQIDVRGGSGATVQ